MIEAARSTWQELEPFMGPDTVFLLPVGSTEPHGPHLCLDTDVKIAQATAAKAAALLDGAGQETCLLPALAYGVTRFADGFAGALSLRPGTLWALVEDLVITLEEAGARRLVLCNAHLEPEHIRVLRGVALDHAHLCKDRLQLLFPDHTRRAAATRLSPEFQSGECHAGQYETSIIAACDPCALREDLRQGLPPKQIGLLEGMKGGARSFQDLGADLCYCGDPAAASADHGEQQLEALASIILDACREAWPTLFR